VTFIAILVDGMFREVCGNKSGRRKYYLQEQIYPIDHFTSEGFSEKHHWNRDVDVYLLLI
jgi:hypothetical protein